MGRLTSSETTIKWPVKAADALFESVLDEELTPEVPLCKRQTLVIRKPHRLENSRIQRETIDGRPAYVKHYVAGGWL